VAFDGSSQSTSVPDGERESSVAPLRHVPVWHTPATQAAPDAHARPQPPQCEVLVCVFASQPLDASMSQSAKPVAHVSPHVPAAHVAVALAPAGHALPQRPQCEVLVCVFASQPFVASLSQLAKPALQVDPQAPDVHVAVALARAGHATPHRPQLATSPASVTSQPLSARRSQSATPAEHT
jgi:hypothetical protein